MSFLSPRQLGIASSGPLTFSRLLARVLIAETLREHFYPEFHQKQKVATKKRALDPLVAQWIRTRLPMHRTRVRSLGRKDPTRRRTAQYCTTTTDRVRYSCSQRRLRTASLPYCPGKKCRKCRFNLWVGKIP